MFLTRYKTTQWRFVNATVMKSDTWAQYLICYSLSFITHPVCEELK